MAKETESLRDQINIIGSGTTIKGDIDCTGDMRIDGKVTGNLKISGKIVIGPTGDINGQITCKNSEIEGKVDGKIYVAELLVLKMAYGAWSESRTICLTDNKPASLRVPYVELGAGIGNILRIGNIYAVFRLTHHDDTAPWWAVRFRLHIET